MYFHFLNAAMSLGVTPFLCFDVDVCPTDTLNDDQGGVQDIEDMIWTAVPDARLGEGALHPADNNVLKEEMTDLVEERNSLKDEKRSPVYRKVCDVLSNHHRSNLTMAWRSLLSTVLTVTQVLVMLHSGSLWCCFVKCLCGGFYLDRRFAPPGLLLPGSPLLPRWEVYITLLFLSL